MAETSIIIPEEVLESIVAISGVGADGVYSIGTVTKDKIDKVGSNTIGGIKVEVNDNKVTVYLTATVIYGFNIPEVSKDISDKVEKAICLMTEYTVSAINIKFDGITFIEKED